MKPYLYLMLVACLALVFGTSVTGQEPVVVPAPPGAEMAGVAAEDVMAAQRVERVSPRDDLLLRSVEQSDREFKRLDNPMINITSYFHQRRIGDAIVEKDFIRYQFDATTGEMLEHTRNWRDGLPETATVVVSRAKAETEVRGEVRSSVLMFISPESEIFHFDPVPTNPCWVVRSMEEAGRQVITVIDAVTGELLGNGLPPPAEGLSIHGPDHGACPQDPIWLNHAQNAHDWFETMGYTTDRVGNASETTVYNHIRSDDGVMFYELDHGGSTSFHNRCDQDITATEIESWIAPYSSMGFAFIGSCGGLCNTGEDNFAAEFSKAHTTDATVVGYCGMADPECDDCWPNAIAWQTELFTRMNTGYTVGTAYAFANAAFPDCTDDSHNCMRIFGDTALVFGGSTYPDVRRSFSGNIYDIYIYPPGIYFSPLQPVASTTYTRAHHLRGSSTVPGGYFLTVTANSSYPYNEIAFDSNAMLTANGPLNANAGTGVRVKFVSAADKGKGIEIVGSGELRLLNGGQIRIYE
jgi:hypothetical protein